MSQSTSIRRQRVREIAKRLPKVQLHLHFDGSLSADFIAEAAEKRRFKLPVPPESLRRYLINLKEKERSSNTFVQQTAGNWGIFDFCNLFLQKKHELQQALETLIRSLIRQNVSIIEIRFCPHLHTNEGLDVDSVVDLVATTFSKFSIKGGIILCALRSYPPSHVHDIIRLYQSFSHKRVIGIDLAGDELSYPLSTHEEALRKAVQLGIPVTIHAGEWSKEHGDCESVVLAVDIGAKRLGHALPIDDVVVAERVREAGVVVETCIIANCTGGKKVARERYDLHPIGKWLKMNLSVGGFNCDNLLLSGTQDVAADPTEEIVRARMDCKLTWKQIANVLITGAKASFDPTVRENDDAFLKDFEEKVWRVAKEAENEDPDEKA